MSEINQSLGFDASQAIDSLGKLQQSLSGVNAQIERMNKSTKGANLGGISSPAKKATDSLNRLDKSTKTAAKSTARLGNEGAKNVGKLGNAFTSLGRIFAANVIIQNVRRIIGALDEASDAAREFELTIQRTLTIAGNDTSIRNLSAQVRELALELGKPLEEVSSAAFQTLQNDVGNTAESFRFLGEAAKLSTALGEDLELAMNALTSIQKSYGQSSAEAAANADTLFVAIDKGRITLQQLGKRLGTINPLAATLGLEFEQTAAAAAALTQTGLRTSTATTQLRNVFSKLIRPTESLQAGFERLGVQTGPQLIEKFGGDLPAALQALRGAFNDSDIAVANAFGTIRGQLGVLNLLADEGSLVTGILGDFADKAGEAQAAFDTVEATKARDYEKEIAKLSDTMLELGERFVDVELVGLRVFNSLISGADGAVAALTSLGSAAGFFFATFSTGASTAAKATRVFLASLPVAGVFATLGAQASLFISDITKTFDEAAREIEQRVVREQNRIAKQKEIALQKSSRDIERISRKGDKALVELAKQSADQFQNFQVSYAESTRRVEITSARLGDNFAEGRKQLLTEIDNFIQGIDNRIAEGLGRIQSAQQDLADLRFDEQIRGLDRGEQAMAQMRRSSETAAEALRAFSQAGVDEDRIEAARELQDLAEQQAREALSTVGDEQERARVAQNLEEIIKQRIRTEQQGNQQLERVDRTRFGEQRDRIAQLQAEAANLQEQLAQTIQRTDETGRPRSSEEIREDRELAGRLRARIEEIKNEIRNIEIVDALNLEGLVDKTTQAFQAGFESAQFDFTNAIQQLQTQISSTPFSIQVETVLRDIAGRSPELAQRLRESRTAGGDPVATGQAFQQANKEFLEEQGRLQRERKALEESANSRLRAFSDLMSEAPRSAGWLDRLDQGFTNMVVDGIQFLAGREGTVEQQTAAKQELEDLEIGFRAPDEVSQGVLDVAIAMERLNRESEPTQQQLDNASEAISEASDKMQKFKEEGTIDADQLQAFNTLMQQANLQVSDLQKRLDILPKIADETEVKQAQDAIKNLGEATAGLSRATGQAAEGFRRVEQAARQAAAAGSQAMSTAAGAGGGGLGIIGKNGNLLDFQNHGGMTRGMDNIPVMAREDEFFVNQRSSRRFFSELSAINAGQRPVFRDEGGSVTNVGDISVNVHTQGEGIDGHRLTKSIQREIRRNPNSFRR